MAGPRQLIVMGATGLVGGHLVDILGADPTVARIVAPVRRPTTRWTALSRVETPEITDEGWERGTHALSGDQVFLCLGTTRRKAGSRAGFRAVDFDLVVRSARAALDGGATDAFLVSSVGARPDAGNFYLRVKAEAESALQALPFRSVHIFRPSVLTGDRRESRPAERMGIVVGTLLAPLMVGRARRYRPIAAETVARAMARVSASPDPGCHIHESEAIATLGS